MNFSNYAPTSAEDAQALSLFSRGAPPYSEITTTASTISVSWKAPQRFPTTGMRKQISNDEWESLKPLIQRLYIDENQSFRYVAKVIRESHDFFPTKRQFTRKISEWGFKKHVSRDERRAILQSLGPVKFGSTIEVSGRKISRLKLEQWKKGFRNEGPHPVFSTPSTAATEILNHGTLPSALEFIASPTTSGSPPLVAMELYSPALEFDVETHLASLDGDHWPFGRWANVDVIGSPKLTSLFENLKLESNSLPDDIELLALSTPSPIPENERTGEYVSCTDLMVLCDDRNIPHHNYSDKLLNFRNARKDFSNFPSCDPATWTPFKTPHSDVFFPSGDQVFPSPFNELYPFPSRPSRTIQSSWTSGPIVFTYQKQEVEYDKKLQQLRRVCDETQPGVIAAMYDLISAYWDQGKFSQAEFWLRKVLSALHRINEATSPFGLETQIDLIDAIRKQGRVSAANEMHEEVHQTIIKTLASDHRLAQKSLDSKARILSRMGNHKGEEVACRQLLQLRLNYLGAMNQETLTNMVELASSMGEQKKYAESEELLRIAIELSHKGSRNLPSELVFGLRQLGTIFLDQGRFKEATRIMRLAVEKARLSLGDEDFNTMTCYSLLGEALRLQNLLQESEELLRTTLKLWIKVLGESAEPTLATMVSLGFTLSKSGRHQEAEKWFERTYRTTIEVLAPYDVSTFLACKRLGKCYEAQRRYTDALALYLDLVEKIRIMQSNHPMIAKVQVWIDWAQIRLDSEDGMDI